MCVHNGSRFLDQAMAGIVGQTWIDLEAVVVDDGSTDGTAGCLDRWRAADPRVRVITLGVNRGIWAASNIGLREARGEIIVRHDGDDVSPSGRIARQVAAFDRDPQAVVVSTDYEVIDADGRRLATIRRAEPPEVVAYFQRFFNFIGAGGQAFRRDAALAVGGFREDVRFAADHDLWTRLAERGRLVVLPYVGLRYRMHGHNVTVRWRNEQRAVSRETRRRALSAYLHRPLDDADMTALDHLWDDAPGTGRLARAEAIMREAYATLRRSAPRRIRSRVRSINATRMTITGGRMLARGLPGEAALHLAYALRWHPVGVASAVGLSASRAMNALRRRR